MKQYLIRLDDACPTMDHVKWGRMEEILDYYGVKPMVGVIPHNEDPKQMIEAEEVEFWNEGGTLKRWKKKRWVIALHGYNHCYTSNEGLKGFNPLWSRSEFAGLPVAEQCKKIRKGIAIMRNAGINPRYFFAPSHTFDENTLVALRKESDIRIISDTIATKPYTYRDFVFFPQFSGSCKAMPFSGVFTFCLHPTTMNDKAFKHTEEFLKAHKDEFLSFDDINLNSVGTKTCLSRLLSWVYFLQRNIRGIK